jgi:hypothetical protein
MSTPRRISKHTDGRGRFFDIPVSPGGAERAELRVARFLVRERLIRLIHAAMQTTALLIETPRVSYHARQ